MSTYQRINLSVCDLSGRLIRTLVDGASNYLTIQPSNHVVWDGRDEAGREIPTGVYFYRLAAGDFVDTKKMTVLR